jgi:hypothetical protein
MSASRESDAPSGEQSGLGLLHAQSRILDVLADGSVLEGTAEALMQHLGVRAGAFRLALLDLAAGGWIFTNTTREGIMTIGRERRLRDDGPGSHAERRRPDVPRTTSRWEGVTPVLHR